MNIEYSLFELKNQSEQLASWSMVVQYSILYIHFDMIRSDWVRHTQSCNLLVFFIIWFQNENPLISVKNGITSIQTLTYIKCVRSCILYTYSNDLAAPTVLFLCFVQKKLMHAFVWVAIYLFTFGSIFFSFVQVFTFCNPICCGCRAWSFSLITLF